MPTTTVHAVNSRIFQQRQQPLVLVHLVVNEIIQTPGVLQAKPPSLELKLESVLRVSRGKKSETYGRQSSAFTKTGSHQSIRLEFPTLLRGFHQPPTLDHMRGPR